MARRFPFEVVDGDGHVVETRSALREHGWVGDATPLIDDLLARESREDWDVGIRPGVTTGAFDVDARLADMDKEGVDVAVNYPTPLLGISDFPDPASSASACRAYNDWFSTVYHARAPERLFAMALVPLTDSPAAVVEAKRAVHDLGAVGVMVQPYAGDVHLSDPQLDELWRTVEALGVPVGIHGSRHTCPPHLRGESFRSQSRFYALCHPFQQQVAMGDLVLGGVLARFPRLRVVFLEAACGWMPTYIDRLNEAYESVDDPSVRYPLELAPSEYVRSGNCWFSCEPDEPNLATVVDWLGGDQVIYASDYPHFDCKFPESVQELVDESGLRTATIAKVAGANARALYGI